MIEITRAVEEMSELVVGSRPATGCGSSSFRERLLYRLERDVVAAFTSHHLVEQRAIE
jgi:hypothetical protein